MAVKSSKKPKPVLTLCDKGDCGGCPTVENLGGTIAITDDDGNTVKMTEGQFQILIARGNGIL